MKRRARQEAHRRKNRGASAPLAARAQAPGSSPEIGARPRYPGRKMFQPGRRLKRFTVNQAGTPVLASRPGGNIIPRAQTTPAEAERGARRSQERQSRSRGTSPGRQARPGQAPRRSPGAESVPDSFAIGSESPPGHSDALALAPILEEGDSGTRPGPGQAPGRAAPCGKLGAERGRPPRQAPEPLPYRQGRQGPSQDRAEGRYNGDRSAN